MAMKRIRAGTAQLPALSLRASVSPASINEDERTVDVVWTTGERVLRGYFDQYYEELSLKPKHVRMGRLKNGAPLLNAHNSYDLRAVIGVVESAKLEKDRGVATVRFARGEDDPEADAIFRKVRDGIIRNVSVGYRIHRLEKVEAEEGKVPVYRATDWEPHEISMVPIGADAGAGVRSAGAETNPCEFVAGEQQERAMAKMKTPSTAAATRNEPGEAESAGDAGECDEGGDDADEDDGDGAADSGAETPAPAPSADQRAIADLAVRRERNRVIGIQQLARAMRLPESFAAPHIKDGTSIDRFRKLACKEFERTGHIDVVQSPRVEAGDDARDKFRRAAADWLIQRSGQATAVIDAGKKRGETIRLDPGPARGMTLLRLAEDCVQRGGSSTRGVGPLEIAGMAFETRGGGYQTTSDFPLIIDDAVNRTLLANYELAEDLWRKLAKVGSVSDFKESARVRIGTLGRLDKVPEHAEFKNKPIPDGSAEVVKAETYGNIFAVTRQVVVNDDLGAILRIVEDMGRMAGHTIELEFWALLALNGGLGPVMSDGKTLFHADHGNIQPTGTTLNEAGLDANRLLIAAQTDLGDNLIVMRPHTLLVPLALGTLARKYNNAEFDIDAGDGVTPSGVRGMFEQVIDTPRISGTRRYVLANPQTNPTFEVSFLNGQQTPFTESRDGWRIDGKEYKVRHDFGVNAVDWRTAITDDGTP